MQFHFRPALRARALFCGALLSLLLTTVSSVHAAPGGMIDLAVDATQTRQNLIHARMTFPVSPGPFTLVYPKWIPGEHAPTGPIINLAGLKFSANGQPVTWKRDLVDMYALHCMVPKGASSLDVSLDYLLPLEPGGFTASESSTAHLLDFSWNLVVLYPEGKDATDVTITPHLKLPEGWHYGTALPIARMSADNTIDFQPASLYTLIDSPVIAGEYYRAIPLSVPGETRLHELDLVSDSADALAMPPEMIGHYKNLVAETGALFGARHYRDYHFLYTLSDQVSEFGLEHHESNDSRSKERSVIDPDLARLDCDLLPHEFTHSWNGKFRRPAGLATPDYQQPMIGDLLWVYEGMTQYWGTALAARSGLETPEDYRQHLADAAATLDHRPGREWRPLLDTAVDAQDLYNARNEYSSLRRGTDFYDEGTLIWLEADTIIRKQTNDLKSLDDFCRLFHGGASSMDVPAVKPYTFDDVVAALNKVAPYDWRAFLNARLTATGDHAPLGGITASGWKLVYDDKLDSLDKAAESAYKFKDFSYSLGFSLDKDGMVTDVTPGTPAALGGIAPGMKITGVNGRIYGSDVDDDLLRSALKAGKTDSSPLQLLVQSGEFYHVVALDYHGGEVYPHLVRDPSVPDLLTQIIAPHAPSSAPAAAPNAVIKTGGIETTGE